MLATDNNTNNHGFLLNWQMDGVCGEIFDAVIVGGLFAVAGIVASLFWKTAANPLFVAAFTAAISSYLIKKIDSWDKGALDNIKQAVADQGKFFTLAVIIASIFLNYFLPLQAMCIAGFGGICHAIYFPYFMASVEQMHSQRQSEVGSLEVKMN